jgi:mannosyltransferase
MFQFLFQHTPLLYFTQSVWRDEAFSVLMALRPVSFIITHVSFEPPFYYLLLHFWIKCFGQSEIALRSLSLVAFAAATAIVIVWSEKLFSKHWLSWWLPLFFFFNPMLLYYGMEGRTYGWYILFAILSLWTYTERRWVIWTAATVLGFYTHSYFLIVPFAQVIHRLWTHPLHWKKDPMIRAVIIAAICIAPWFVILIREASMFGHLWYFPVDANLVTSVLGNLFVGYEGTPWYVWAFTKVLSVIILGFSYLALRSEKTRTTVRLFLTQIYLPLIVIIGVSFLKPLYVNRYVIPVTIAEVFIITLAISGIRNVPIQKIIAGLCLLFVLIFNIWYPDKHAKPDIRGTLRQINAVKTKTDVIIADNPLVYFETVYYSTDRTHVYLYNPDNNPFPWYVGGVLVSASGMVTAYPPYPIRAFVVHTDGTFDIVFRTAL